LVAGLPCVLTVGPLILARSAAVRVVLILFGPGIYVLAYVAIAGGLSQIGRRAIVPGRFPRDLGHAVYGPRRIYSLCWTALYYFPPAYHAVLAVPLLKRFVFRMFGYSGSMAFTTYPDTWLRDLPLLTVGEGSYLSNRATISPNMCLRNGKILIAPIAIGCRAMIGHGTLVAPGVVIGSESEVGAGGTIGIFVKIGDHTRVGHAVSLDHGVVIGSHCNVGSRAYVGRNVVIYDGISIPPGAIVATAVVLRTQCDVDTLLHSKLPTSPQPAISAPGHS